VSSPKGGFPEPLSPDSPTGRYRRRVMPYSKESIRAHGQILVDFANAENTDEACFAYFKNIQSSLGFSSKFDEQIKKNFPYMSSFSESMNEAEKELLELVLKEKLKLSFLNNQLNMIGYNLEDYDSQNKNLSLSQIHLDGGLYNGEPDVMVTKEGPFVYS
jgi:hypothetical protein